MEYENGEAFLASLSDHLPECKAKYPPVQGQGGTGPAYVYPCICKELYACQERVLRGMSTPEQVAEYGDVVFSQGSEYMRDACVKAVEAVFEHVVEIDDDNHVSIRVPTKAQVVLAIYEIEL